MGSTGGTFKGGYTPDKYKEILRKTASQTIDIAYETAVNELINNVLAESARDADRTNEHLDRIKGTLEDGIDGTLIMRFGGSVHKHTYVDGLSDIDILVVVNRSELNEENPNQILNYIANKLHNASVSGISELRIGELAVTVEFSDGEKIQLLPALKHNDGYKIPGKGNSWSNMIRPEKFANKLTEVNQSCGGKVVPVIKLAKNIIYELPEDQQITGYHIESLAVEAFKNYPQTGSRAPKNMLNYLFEKSKDLVKDPIADETGQSLHVDDYLGPKDSKERQKISYVLDRISRRMKNADRASSIDEWKAILGLE